MFLNQGNKYNDTSQQSSINACGVVDSGQGSSAAGGGGLKFPTSILENLLQNSDILETLMKPISGDDGSDIMFDEKAFAKKLEENDLTKNYGNAFLGPNLWSKSDLFPSDKFGVKLEYLDVQEFLAENELNECDFLDELSHNLDPKNMALTTQSSTSPLTTNNNTLPPLPPAQSLLIPPLNKQKSDNSSSGMSLGDFSITTPSAFNFALDSTDASNNDLRDFIMNSTSNTSYKRKLSQDIDTSDDMSSDDDDNDSCVDFLDDDSSILNDEELFAKISKMTGEELSAYRKSRKQFVPNELKDEKYWSRRRKNNLAAKRSRDARRLKETQVALRAAFLERENSNLRRQLDECKRETRVLKTKLSRYEQKKD